MLADALSQQRPQLQPVLPLHVLHRCLHRAAVEQLAWGCTRAAAAMAAAVLGHEPLQQCRASACTQHFVNSIRPARRLGSLTCQNCDAHRQVEKGADDDSRVDTCICTEATAARSIDTSWLRPAVQLGMIQPTGHPKPRHLPRCSSLQRRRRHRHPGREATAQTGRTALHGRGARAMLTGVGLPLKHQT